MENAGMSAKEESQPRNPMNNEEDNIREGEIWVDLNESQDNKYELRKIVKKLRSELKRVRENNERILKAQEELNNILLSKIHIDEKEKNKEPRHNMPKPTPSRHKGRKLEFSSHGDETSSEESIKHHTEKQQDSSESSDDNKKKNKYKPYEEISRELKRIKQ